MAKCLRMFIIESNWKTPAPRTLNWNCIEVWHKRAYDKSSNRILCDTILCLSWIVFHVLHFLIYLFIYLWLGVNPNTKSEWRMETRAELEMEMLEPKAGSRKAMIEYRIVEDDKIKQILPTTANRQL